MLGVHVDLQPVLVKEVSNIFELLVVEITAGDTKIRLLSGYGPQENWEEKDRSPFFEAMETEIASAELEGRSVIICMDANSKLGPEYIEGDPHCQSKNGKLLADILDRHAFIVLNGVKQKCTGLITREKITTEGVERGVIDFVIASSDLINHIESIHIDDKRDHVLTKLVKQGKHKKKVESDHNIIITKINLPWKTNLHEAIEVFNFKDKESLVKFVNATNKCEELIAIFETNKSLEVQTRKFIKQINGLIHECFKKVKITSKSDPQLDKLYDKRRYLRTKDDEKSVEELEAVEEELATKYSETMFKKINQEIKGIRGDEGGYNPGHLWKLKKKLSPKHNEPPVAMKDAEGNILTNEEEIRAEALRHYRKVFEDKPIDEKYKEYEIEKEKLCEMRLEIAAENKTPPWTVEDVICATKHLNSGISKDPYGHPNELYKDGVAGQDLIKAVTTLMNKIKDNPQEYPTSLDLCNITSNYKHKGDKNDFDSYRGVFRTTTLRNILDRLIYEDEYHTVDDNLTDCNVGSRKKRNIRDNLFVINAIMNSSKKGDDEACDVCVYDVRKCFDSLWMFECINDLYESGLKNNKLCLIFHSNKNARVAIKTPSGLSDRFTINKKVMQGTV